MWQCQHSNFGPRCELAWVTYDAYVTACGGGAVSFTLAIRRLAIGARDDLGFEGRRRT